MITLNTNLASMIVQSNLQKSTNALNTAIERMTSGYKINGAKDNAANYSITTNMSTKIEAYQVAEDNVAMGLDLLSTASENLDLISDKLTRLRALAEQSANGTYGEQSKQAINAEANALVDEIERICSNASYNGIKVGAESTGMFLKSVEKKDTSTMTTMSAVDETSTISSGSYSLSTPEDLFKLSRMTKAGKVGENTEFVFTNNIDLSGYGKFCIENFEGVLDGNGYELSNLQEDGSGWQGIVQGDSPVVQNLGFANVSLNSSLMSNSTTNCFNCYVINSTVEKSIIDGHILNVENFYAYNIESPYVVGFLLTNDELLSALDSLGETNSISIQAGIDASASSSISFVASVPLGGLGLLRGIGNSSIDLSLVDAFIDKVSAKQTEYGAAQNRLESALEEISTQYENLVSSRSTLRDADIAEVSSEYIRQQILQQASATLLATANQSPALALQLL